jgi:hypothetical protein
MECLAGALAQERKIPIFAAREIFWSDHDASVRRVSV